MSFLQALVAGSLAQPQVPGDVTSPRHSHLQRLVHQISRERDECQSRLNQLQVRHYALLFLVVLSCSEHASPGFEGEGKAEQADQGR